MRTAIIATVLSVGLSAAPAAFAAGASAPCTDRSDPKCASAPANVKDNKAQTPAQKQKVTPSETKKQKAQTAQTKGQNTSKSQTKDSQKPLLQPKQ